MSSSFFRGQRFHIDLDSGSGSDSGSDSVSSLDGNGNGNGDGDTCNGNEKSEDISESKKIMKKAKKAKKAKKEKARDTDTDTIDGNETRSHGDKGLGNNENNKNLGSSRPSDTATTTASVSHSSTQTESLTMPMSLIADVCERRPPSTSTRKAPLPPDLKSDTGGGSLATGFPAHRKRMRGSGLGLGSGLGSGSGSVFRNGGGRNLQREEGGGGDLQKGGQTSTAKSRGRSNSIDRENRAKLAAMTPAEIEKERDELMAQLSPAFVERLMKRVNIDHRYGDDGVDGLNGDNGNDEDDAAEFPELQRRTGMKSPQEERKIREPEEQRSEGGQAEDTPDNTTMTLDINQPRKTVSFASPPPSPSSINPDRPPSPRTLRRLYFPDQPPPDAIPALSWTLPLSSSSTNNNNNNNDSKTSLSISALRFSLNGALIPPSVAISLPVTLGLHHHAANPDAAGYTISELTRLSRSAMPAQRCVAIKALGGVGKWMAEQMEIERVGRDDRTDGHDDDDEGNKAKDGNALKSQKKMEDKEKPNEDKDKDNPRVALLKGLWTLAKEERVLDILLYEAAGDGERQQQQQQQKEHGQNSHLHRHHHNHHQSVVVYAEDALSAWRIVERQMRVRRAI